MTAPVVIIPWRDDGSQSLRYTLRSLENLPHSEVVIAGDRPSWLTGGVHLETERGHRYARQHDSVFSDSQQSRLAAAAYLGKGYAYLMDDDMFIMEPVDWVAPAHRRGSPIPKKRNSYWQEAGFFTGAWLRSQKAGQRNFETHVPLLVDIEALLDVADQIAASDLRSVWLRSAYGNLVTRHARAITDPKVSVPGGRPHPSWPIWSTSDRAFHGGIAGKQIRRRFNRPSPWEV